MDLEKRKADDDSELMSVDSLADFHVGDFVLAVPITENKTYKAYILELHQDTTNKDGHFATVNYRGFNKRYNERIPLSNLTKYEKPKPQEKTFENGEFVMARFSNGQTYAGKIVRRTRGSSDKFDVLYEDGLSEAKVASALRHMKEKELRQLKQRLPDLSTFGQQTIAKDLYGDKLLLSIGRYGDTNPFILDECSRSGRSSACRSRSRTHSVSGDEGEAMRSSSAKRRRSSKGDITTANKVTSSVTKSDITNTTAASSTVSTGSEVAAQPVTSRRSGRQIRAKCASDGTVLDLPGIQHQRSRRSNTKKGKDERTDKQLKKATGETGIENQPSTSAIDDARRIQSALNELSNSREERERTISIGSSTAEETTPKRGDNEEQQRISQRTRKQTTAAVDDKQELIKQPLTEDGNVGGGTTTVTLSAVSSSHNDPLPIAISEKVTGASRRKARKPVHQPRPPCPTFEPVTSEVAEPEAAVAAIEVETSVQRERLTDEDVQNVLEKKEKKQSTENEVVVSPQRRERRASAVAAMDFLAAVQAERRASTGKRKSPKSSTDVSPKFASPLTSTPTSSEIVPVEIRAETKEKVLSPNSNKITVVEEPLVTDESPSKLGIVNAIGIEEEDDEAADSFSPVMSPVFGSSLERNDDVELVDPVSQIVGLEAQLGIQTFEHGREGKEGTVSPDEPQETAEQTNQLQEEKSSDELATVAMDTCEAEPEPLLEPPEAPEFTASVSKEEVEKPPSDIPSPAAKDTPSTLAATGGTFEIPTEVPSEPGRVELAIGVVEEVKSDVVDVKSKKKSRRDNIVAGTHFHPEWQLTRPWLLFDEKIGMRCAVCIFGAEHTKDGNDPKGWCSGIRRHLSYTRVARHELAARHLTYLPLWKQRQQTDGHSDTLNVEDGTAIVGEQSKTNSLGVDEGTAVVDPPSTTVLTKVTVAEEERPLTERYATDLERLKNPLERAKWEQEVSIVREGRLDYLLRDGDFVYCLFCRHFAATKKDQMNKWCEGVPITKVRGIIEHDSRRIHSVNLERYYQQIFNKPIPTKALEPDDIKCEKCNKAQRSLSHLDAHYRRCLTEEEYAKYAAKVRLEQRKALASASSSLVQRSTSLTKTKRGRPPLSSKTSRKRKHVQSSSSESEEQMSDTEESDVESYASSAVKEESRASKVSSYAEEDLFGDGVAGSDSTWSDRQTPNSDAGTTGSQIKREEDSFPYVDCCSFRVLKEEKSKDMDFFLETTLSDAVCEKCKTWQHGKCIGKKLVKNVQSAYKGYTCYVCAHPKGRRVSFERTDDIWRRLRVDAELPSVSATTKNEETSSNDALPRGELTRLMNAAIDRLTRNERLKQQQRRADIWTNIMNDPSHPEFRRLMAEKVSSSTMTEEEAKTAVYDELKQMTDGIWHHIIQQGTILNQEYNVDAAKDEDLVKKTSDRGVSATINEDLRKAVQLFQIVG